MPRDEESKCHSCLQKGKKDDVGNNRPISDASVPMKVMEQLILEAISRHMKNKEINRSSQHGFIKGMPDQPERHPQLNNWLGRLGSSG